MDDEQLKEVLYGDVAIQNFTTDDIKEGIIKLELAINETKQFLAIEKKALQGMIDVLQERQNAGDGGPTKIGDFDDAPKVPSEPMSMDDIIAADMMVAANEEAIAEALSKDHKFRPNEPKGKQPPKAPKKERMQ